jgi:periplasmic protein TonB
VNYLAAFFAALVLHAVLAALSGGFLGSGAEGMATTERIMQQGPLVLTFYKPTPARLPSESTELKPRLQPPEPPPESESPPPEPAVTTPETGSPVETEETIPPGPALPQRSIETGPRPPNTIERPHQQPQTFSRVQIEKPRPLQPIDAEAVYPLGARLRGEEGAVRILVRINPDGRIDELEIRESSGFTALDRAAERAVRRTRFAPASRKNQPVAGELTITIRFSLDS